MRGRHQGSCDAHANDPFMIVAIPRERLEKERRVALVPDVVTRMIKSGAQLRVQRGAGVRAGFPDEVYERAGATLFDDARSLVEGADAVIVVGRPSDDVLAAMRKDALLVGLLAPLGDSAYVQTLAKTGITAIAMELIPRITRAQAMDVLSSQSNIAGYKAILNAAAALPKFFPMLTTAAGTIAPAKVFIIGAGVAGLQAIATARRLGAVVTAYDARAVVAEQVKSLGAQFAQIDLGGDAEGAGGYAKELTAEQIAIQQEGIAKYLASSDVCVTTALVPGRPAPRLITAAAVAGMKPGSVIVDLAAEAGGNCELTKMDEIVTSSNGVRVDGTTNLPSTVPLHASQLYARNIVTLLESLTKDGAFVVNRETDEIAKGACICMNGEAFQ